MNQATSNQPECAVSHEMILAQLERLLASRHFSQTRSLDKFLQHVVLKTLAGEESDLKESLIGREVFHRGVEFDPAKDSVVRVQAGVLRKKLASYYEDEGCNDEVGIILPKGHYVPEFSLRETETTPSQQMIVRAVASEALHPTTQPLAQIPGRSRWKVVGAIGLFFTLGLITAILIQNLPFAAKGQRQNASFAPADSLLWEKFLQPNAENILAYGTPQFFVANGIFLRDVQINSPEEFSDGTRLKALQATLQNQLQTELRPTETYTGVGETHGVYLLSRFLWKTALDPKVTSSRMIRWNELKNANVIFLSSMRFHTLAKELPFPNDFVIKAGNAGQIINLHPQEGEKTIYGRTESDPINDYAVITLWPGKSSQQRVLVLSGNTTFGTMAAAEYVTEPEYLRQLHSQLEQCRINHGAARHSPYFQVLVCADVKDNQPFKISYITHHDLEIPHQAIEQNQTVSLR